MFMEHQPTSEYKDIVEKMPAQERYCSIMKLLNLRDETYFYDGSFGYNTIFEAGITPMKNNFKHGF